MSGIWPPSALTIRHRHWPSMRFRLACKEATERVDRITAPLRELRGSWRMNPLVKALMCLKGLDFIAAITFVAEVGDLCKRSIKHVLYKARAQCSSRS